MEEGNRERKCWGRLRTRERGRHSKRLGNFVNLCFYIFTRTSIDIPDGLFREAKAAASLRGETLKAFLLRALRSELSARKSEKKTRAKLPLVKSKEKTYDVSPDRLAGVLEEEDREILAGH